MPSAKKNKLLSSAIKQGLDTMKDPLMDYKTEVVSSKLKSEDVCLKYVKIIAMVYFIFNLWQYDSAHKTPKKNLVIF